MIVIARLLRDDDWQGTVVILRQSDDAIVERTFVSATIDA
jgi:hypothetical protein